MREKRTEGEGLGEIELVIEGAATMVCVAVPLLLRLAELVADTELEAEPLAEEVEVRL